MTQVPGAYAVYFLPAGDEGTHQLDQIQDYFGTGVDPEQLKKEWKTECQDRGHGFHDSDFVCWCFSQASFFYNKPVTPTQCEDCPVRRWRDKYVREEGSA